MSENLMIGTKGSEDSLNPSIEDFKALLEESLERVDIEEGKVVKGRVVSVENDFVIVDVGLKTEGRVPLREFVSGDEKASISVGDEVDIYLERVENALGEAILSREKACREEVWSRLEQSFASNECVEGSISGRVKGGFTVDLGGLVAFLPGSQVDLRLVSNISPLMNMVQPFQILKMDRRRNNVVVSRRAILEASRAEQRHEIVQNLTEDQIVEGTVKNITDYGAFIDLGGVDGLLHVTDLAWGRVSHPSDLVSVGDVIKVKIIRINPETNRISLGLKQLEPDPWLNAEEEYQVGTRVKGVITNITDYGAFVEIRNGIEGLIHISELSWVKKNIHPSRIVSTSEEVAVIVLDVEHDKRRISLSLKQTQENPWAVFSDKFKEGDIVEGEIKNITDFGLFVGLEGGVDGMIHLSNIDWHGSGEEVIKGYRKGDTIKAIILDVNVEKERIGLGIKQLTPDPMEALGRLKKNDVVTTEVIEVQEKGIEVKITDTDISSFIRRSDLARARSEQRPERFAPGDKLDAQVTQIDISGRKVSLSVKVLEIEEEKAAVAQYGSSDSGASLGDILGAALSKATIEDGAKEGQKKEEQKKEGEKKEVSKKASSSKKKKAQSSEDGGSESEGEISASDSEVSGQKKVSEKESVLKEEKADKTPSLPDRDEDGAEKNADNAASQEGSQGGSDEGSDEALDSK